MSIISLSSSSSYFKCQVETRHWALVLYVWWCSVFSFWGNSSIQKETQIQMLPLQCISNGLLFVCLYTLYSSSCMLCVCVYVCTHTHTQVWAASWWWTAEQQNQRTPTLILSSLPLTPPVYRIMLASLFLGYGHAPVRDLVVWCPTGEYLSCVFDLCDGMRTAAANKQQNKTRKKGRQVCVCCFTSSEWIIVSH